MSSLDAIRSNKPKIKKIKKTLGNRLVEDRKRLNKLQQTKSKTFNEAINNLNKTLKRSESLFQINHHYPPKNNINAMLPKYEINYLKKMEYYKKWHFNILPIINKTNNQNQNKINNNIKDNPISDDKKNKNNISNRKSNFNFKHLGSLYKPNRNSMIRNNLMKSNSQIIDENIPFYLKGLQPRKSNINASEIVKISVLELNKKNIFKKYRYNMEEKVGNFVDYNDKFSNYYDFDQKVKKNIKDEKTGISMPGNIINRSSLGFIRTLQPKNIKIKIKKSVSVPEKTLLPVPNGIVGKGLSYTHITLKDVYNEKNKLI